MRPISFQYPFGLRRRITLTVGLLISSFVAAALANNLFIQRQLIDSRLDERAESLGRLVAEITGSYLYDLRVAELEIVYEDIERQDDVEEIIFVDPSGLKMVSGSINGSPGSSFLEIVEDDLIDAAREAETLLRRREGEFERVAVPAVIGDEYLGTVSFTLRRSGYNAELATVGRRNLLLGVIFLVAAVVMSWVIARNLTSPLHKLVALTDRAAAGDLDQRIEVRTNDEFEILARSFDTMLQTVRANLEEIHKLAYRDELTGLSNRAWFQTMLSRAVGTAQAEDGSLALLFLDLDQFKQLNDSLGHQVGDELLAAVASRLRECAESLGPVAAPSPIGVSPGRNTVSRLGGDEFTLLIPNATAASSCALAERLLDSFATPFEIAGTTHLASTSIGIALCPDHATCPEVLLKNADIAIYQAKQSGRNTFRLFDAEMATKSIRRLALERELRVAIAENQFEIVLQPQFQTTSRQLIGAEVLVRWRHPTDGLLSPDTFLPIAAEAKLLPEIGRRVFKLALEAFHAWRLPPDRAFRLALNASVEELESEGFSDWLLDLLDRHHVSPGMIELEMTECAAIFDSDRVEQQVGVLQAAGIRFAVDDFGIGYSNLGRLKRLAFETLKIDRSLMQGVGEDDGAAVLVESIVNMAMALDLEVLAEGVETEVQLGLLRGLGCHYVQGYLLGRPMTAEAFAEWLRSGARPAAMEPPRRFPMAI